MATVREAVGKAKAATFKNLKYETYSAFFFCFLHESICAEFNVSVLINNVENSLTSRRRLAEALPKQAADGKAPIATVEEEERFIFRFIFRFQTFDWYCKSIV